MTTKCFSSFYSITSGLIAFCILFLSSTAQSLAATPSNQLFKQLTVEDGLIQNSVYAIHQDSKGFMWFGTYGGLSRYDGYEFVNYGPSDTKYGLSSPDIYNIVEDNQQNLWLATGNGLIKFNPRLERFTTFFVSKEPASNIINTLLFHEQTLWLGTQHGLYHFNLDQQSFSLIDLSDHGPTPVITSLSLSPDNSLWIAATSMGLIHLNLSTGITKKQPITLNGNQNINYIHFVLYHNNFLWLSNGKNAYKHDIYRHHSEPIFKQFSPASRRIHRLVAAKNSLWIGSNEKGLYHYDLNSSVITHYPHNDKYGISSNRVGSIYISKSNQLWIGTLINGVNYSSTVKEFTLHKKNTNNTTGLPDNLINNIHKDPDGHLWFATNKGVSRFNSEHNSYKNYEVGLSYCLLTDNNKETLWIGTSQGLYSINLNDKKLTYEKQFLGYRISQIYQLSTNELIFATYSNGLLLWNAETKKLRTLKIKNSLSNKSQASSFIAKYFYKLSDEQLLVGTSNRLLILNLNDLKLSIHTPGQSDAVFLNAYITYINRDIKNNLWIATNNKGIFILDSQYHILKHITESDGLPNRAVRAISFINETAWVSTDSGLVTININNPKQNVKPINEVFFNMEFQSKATLLAGDNQLLFGGLEGAIEFNPNNFKHTQQNYSIEFTDFSLFNKSVKPGNTLLPEAIRYQKGITLNHTESLFSVKFSALDYLHPKNLHYFYQIEGFADDRWISTSYKDRQITLSALPAGEYTLKVRASDSKQHHQASEAHLKITVLPPWWKTTWAYSSYALLLSLSILFFIKIRTRRILQHAVKLEGVVKERTEELRDKNTTIEQLMDKKNEMFANISHELRTPITLIQGPIQQALKQLNDHPINPTLQLAERNVQRLNFLVDQLLQLSRIYYLSDDNKKNQSLSDITEIIAASFNSISASKGIQLTTHIAPNIAVSAIANSLETILINLLSNAFKYTNKNGHVLLTLSEKNNKAIITVKDDGIGIPEQSLNKIFDRFTRIETQANKKIEGVGVGLALVKQLAESHGGTISVNSSENQGSEFIVHLPCCDTADEKTEKSSNQIKAQLDHESNRHIHYLENILKEKSTNSTDETTNSVSKESENNDDYKPRLLIIDDTDDIRTYLGSLLTPQYQCFFASDGETGVKKAWNEIPDIIISDVMMPGISGLEVLDQLRSDIRTSHIPVLLLTAKGDKETKLLGLSKLADDYITKPFDADELLTRIQNILTIRKLQQQQLYQLSTDNALNADNSNLAGLSPKEKSFLDKFNQIIDTKYMDETFGVEELSQQLNMSGRALLYKIKAIFGKTPNEYIREYRLNAAKQLILNNKASLSELAYSVGFSSSSYFSKCFKAYVGSSPKAYAQKNYAKGNNRLSTKI